MNDFRHGGLTRRRTGEGDKVVAHPRRSRFRSIAAAPTSAAAPDSPPATDLNAEHQNEHAHGNPKHTTEHQSEDQSPTTS